MLETKASMCCPKSSQTGPRHLNTGEDLEEKLGVPGGFEASFVDALALNGPQSQELKGNMAQHGGVSAAHPARMRPWSSWKATSSTRWTRFSAPQWPRTAPPNARAERARLSGYYQSPTEGSAPMRRLPDHAEAPQAGSGMSLLEPGQPHRIAEHRGAPDLDPPMPLLKGLGAIMGDTREAVRLPQRNTQPHVLSIYATKVSSPALSMNRV